MGKDDTIKLLHKHNEELIMKNKPLFYATLFYCIGYLRTGSLVGFVDGGNRVIDGLDKRCLKWIGFSKNSKIKDTYNQAFELMRELGIVDGDKLSTNTCRGVSESVIYNSTPPKDYTVFFLSELAELFHPVTETVFNVVKNEALFRKQFVGKPNEKYGNRNIKVDENGYCFYWKDIEGLFRTYFYIMYNLNFQMIGKKNVVVGCREGAIATNKMREDIKMSKERMMENIAFLLKLKVLKRRKGKSKDDNEIWIWEEKQHPDYVKKLRGGEK